jgi:hypothetical protein
VLPVGLVVLVLIAANGIACASLPSLLNPYDNLKSVYLRGHLYRLDSIYSGTLRDLDTILLVWECDGSGLFCRVIYAENFYANMVPNLTAEPTTDTLLFTVNDKVFYTYKP